ncbi:hypothetical protein Q4595_20455, partial [Wenyingzhuangia sp. 1_MG-2023]|nr:hypothetical protein [Wenyingzhuangia sp. 1_MG-2023]
ADQCPDQLSLLIQIRLLEALDPRRLPFGNVMTNPVTVRYMSRSEIESLMYSLTADSDNEQAQLFEAITRRLLEILESENR